MNTNQVDDRVKDTLKAALQAVYFQVPGCYRDKVSFKEIWDKVDDEFFEEWKRSVMGMCEDILTGREG